MVFFKGGARPPWIEDSMLISVQKVIWESNGRVGARPVGHVATRWANTSYKWGLQPLKVGL